VGVFYVKPANWFPFLPYGFNGVVTAAGIVFFAYLGFDAISTTAEEAKNPKRDLPIGIIASLSICTVLYIIVCLVLTGIVPAVQYSTDQAFLNAPIAFALNLIHQNWVSGLISIGAIAGLTSVLLVLLIGQPRIFFAMSRDKLLPEKLSQVHPKYQTPYLTTIGTGVIVGVIALLIDIGSAAELCSIGTLFAFVIVCSGIFVLRKTDSKVPIAFRTPALGFIAPLGILGCLYLMYGLPVKTWIRFLVWLDIGMLIYFFYGRSHSRLAAESRSGQKTTVKYFIKFFGVLTVINGAMFGLLSLIVTLQMKYTIGIGDVKSWQALNMDPVKFLAYSGIVFIVGLIAWFFTKGKESGVKAQ
jgi:APA family basic amino acid/polyamine antiporter